jgi:hypothetical protein
MFHQGVGFQHKGKGGAGKGKGSGDGKGNKGKGGGKGGSNKDDVMCPQCERYKDYVWHVKTFSGGKASAMSCSQCWEVTQLHQTFVDLKSSMEGVCQMLRSAADQAWAWENRRPTDDSDGSEWLRYSMMCTFWDAEIHEKWDDLKQACIDFQEVKEKDGR